MYRHILVATDGSALSQRAVKVAVALAKSVKAKLTIFHAYPPFRLFDEGYVMPDAKSVKDYFKRGARTNAEKVASSAEKIAQRADLSVTSVLVETDQIHEAIINTAKRKKCDLIVMASHGRKGLSGLLLGSETAKVLTHSKTPVLVIR
jgi:nucleotide-binding universal stress UspA family protein